MNLCARFSLFIAASSSSESVPMDIKFSFASSTLALRFFEAGKVTARTKMRKGSRNDYRQLPKKVCFTRHRLGGTLRISSDTRVGKSINSNNLEAKNDKFPLDLRP